MADTFVESWNDSAMSDYPLFISKASGDTGNINGLVAAGTDLNYSPQDMRDLLLAMVTKSGVASSSNFTLAPYSLNAVTVSTGFAFIMSNGQTQGVYFVRQRGSVTLPLPTYVSGTEQYRVVIEIDDRADNPSSTYPTNYGWHYRVLDNVGSSPAAVPAGAMNVGIVQKTASGAMPTVLPFSATNAQNIVSFGRNDPGSGVWYSMSVYSTWTYYGSSYATPKYRRNNDGQVQLQGMFKAGSSSGSGYLGSTGEAMVILPAGYQPASTLLFSAQGRYQGTEKSVRVTIYGANTSYPGYIVPYGGANTNWVNGSDWISLDGINFQASVNSQGESY